MRKDIVSAEAELSVAANQIARYADFLAESVQTYVQILSRLQTQGIQDDLVCARLTEIALSVQPAVRELGDQSETIRSKVSEFISEVEKVDKLAFPSGVIEIIKSVFSQFI